MHYGTELSLSIHSAIYNIVMSLILVCPLKYIKGITLHQFLRYSGGVSAVKALNRVETGAEDPIQPGGAISGLWLLL